MIRMVGAVLVAVGTSWLGIRAAGTLGQELNSLRAASEGLALLERELEWDSPPLSELMRRLVPRCRSPMNVVFQGVYKALDRLEEESLSGNWTMLIDQQTGFEARTKELLLPLGGVLGRCSCEEQRKAVAAVRERLDRLEQELAGERQRKGRLYRVLGVSGGSFLVLLLL